MVGVLFAVRSLPNLLVGFAAGAITDRLDRRILMRVMVCGLALVAWLIAWLVWMEQMALWPLSSVLGSLGSCKRSSSQHGRRIPVMSWASAVLYKVLLSSP